MSKDFEQVAKAPNEAGSKSPRAPQDEMGKTFYARADRQH